MRRCQHEAIQSVFTGGGLWRGVAHIHFGRDRFDLYAYGFRVAAETLADQVIESGTKHDYLIYPICNLYRHYLELRLKQIIRAGRSLLGENDFEKTHDLRALWVEARRILRDLSAYDPEPEGLDLIEPVIEGFARVDPDSTAFRYPEDRSGNTLLATLTHINLPHLASAMAQACDMLEAISTSLIVDSAGRDELLARCRLQA